MVATSNSNAFRWFSAHRSFAVPGKCSASRSSTTLARPAGVRGRGTVRTLPVPSSAMTSRALTLPRTLDGSLRPGLRSLIDRADAVSGHPVLDDLQRAALFGPDDGTGPGPVRAAVLRKRAAGAGDDVLGFAQAVPHPPHGDYALEVAVDPDVGDRSAMVGELLSAVVTEVAERGGGVVRLWFPWVGPDADGWAAEAGFDHERDLLQLRCSLPLAPDGRPSLPTRPFRPGQDEPAWLRANNRAFADHPEQGGWDLAVLKEREAEPWFDPDGFLVHDEEGAIAAWCWTKIHGGIDPPMGEIYVVGVDPDFQGRGWGR